MKTNEKTAIVKVLSFMVVLVILLMAVSSLIDPTKNENTQPNKTNKEVVETEKNIQLSFLDFALGGNFAECLALSQKRQHIDIVTQFYLRKSVHRSELKTLFEGENLVFRVDTHNDTIMQITVFFDKTINGVETDSVFISKYGEPTKRNLWDYKNSIIKLEHKYDSSSEYVRRAGTENLNLRNFNNAYEKRTTQWITGITATYIDKDIARKVEKADSIARINKLKADSLRQVEWKRRVDSIQNNKRIENQRTKERLIDKL
ncbi:MAG: hypothetical protein R3Y16_05175 [Rikenellaceae bacterium]